MRNTLAEPPARQCCLGGNIGALFARLLWGTNSTRRACGRNGPGEVPILIRRARLFLCAGVGGSRRFRPSASGGLRCAREPRSRHPASGARKTFYPPSAIRLSASGDRFSLRTSQIVLRTSAFYSSTKIFLLAHISFKIFGQTVTLTSPRWALRRSSISVRDWPMPPPMESGISFFRIAW